MTDEQMKLLRPIDNFELSKKTKSLIVGHFQSETVNP